jgi:hypothetical protein|tara:strand:+ start:443 stop:658 length:216 start_codon:yes stop_codon:yes gene_type:complete
MFLIKKGTTVDVARLTGETVQHVTKHENLFEKHEVVIDPLFNLGPAAGELYGFERDGFTLYVDQASVTYMG